MPDVGNPDTKNKNYIHSVVASSCATDRPSVWVCPSIRLVLVRRDRSTEHRDLTRRDMTIWILRARCSAGDGYRHCVILYL